MQKPALAMLIAAYVLPFSNSLADSKIEQLQQQLNQLNTEYETRIQALEQQLQTLQDQAEAAELSADVTETPISKNAFNPQISLILNGTYAAYQQNPDHYFIQGFSSPGNADLPRSGFSIGESEISLSANIDQLFYGQLTFALADDGASVEEAFAQTKALGSGLNLKIGRFFSNIGYLNSQHAHSWDFADAPLPYRAFFADQYADDGLQMRYLVPSDLFLELSAEWFAQGTDNWTSAIKIGGDIQTHHSWLLGLSHWQAKNEGKINALDFVYKWQPAKQQHNFKLQFEYFDRRQASQQTAWYAQTRYQFKPQWRWGLRYDQLTNHNQDFKPKRYSTMLEWQASEFSRIRLQYNHDKSNLQTDNQLFLQYIFSLGTHGAHTY